MGSHSSDPLEPGLYDKLLSQEERAALEKAGLLEQTTRKALDPAESHSAFAQYMSHVLLQSLAQFRGKDAIPRQVELLAQWVETFSKTTGESWLDGKGLGSPIEQLLAVREAGHEDWPRPDTPLGRCALFTGSRRDPPLFQQLRQEMPSADRVDIICSFIKWSGLRLILDSLRDFSNLGEGIHSPKIRVITTSYLGATDSKALRELIRIPGCKVKVSYDTQRTRLHAKAYLFHRKTRFGSAYIGSANLSRVALSEGLEWTPKISQYELPHLWEKIQATFESHWNDVEFETVQEGNLKTFEQAIQRERQGSMAKLGTSLPDFELRPWSFQAEILEALQAEREIHGKNRHLIVAATGTGKTMVAAFDYRQWSRQSQRRPRLLFIAHRSEILEQALGTFRAVLRDQNFGELLVGGKEPENRDHLFCSIQSTHHLGLEDFGSEFYEYVVVDEFHHAEAPSYRRLLDLIDPKILLGMTATPERADGLDVLKRFGGEASCEIRLPDAIERRLLSTFHYFGISDSVDLQSVTWKRHGYDLGELDRIYTGNEARSQLVLDQCRRILREPREARGLGFCVSVAHAQFMAKFFSQRGIASLCLSGSSTAEERQQGRDDLAKGKVSFIFTVDLYNEGVDIPEVDTVLLLRPTESLTVYLQQIGRGLRLHEEKECLTILDFIGAQRKEFRFAPRFRSLTTHPEKSVEKEIESGFTHLPAGCSIILEKQAKAKILQNLRENTLRTKNQLIREIRNLRAHLQRSPRLEDVVEGLGIELDEVLRRGLWSRILDWAGIKTVTPLPDEKRLARGLRRLALHDDPRQIRWVLQRICEERVQLDSPTAEDQRRLTQFVISLFDRESLGWSLEEARTRLRKNIEFLNDLEEVFKFRLRHLPGLTREDGVPQGATLSLHASYSRNEILSGLGCWTLQDRREVREGCFHVPDQKIDIFFVTLQKSLEAYSPTTLYEDYAISDRLFHWQSQSTTSEDSPTGRRYRNHREMGYTPLLFVREHNKLPNGLTSPYFFLGPIDYVSHEGSRPISFIWKLRYPMPARLMRWTKLQEVS